MATVRISALSKSFGATNVLRHIDLNVESGRLIAVLGASGSGKTTLLRLLCGFERLDSGTIHVGERQVGGPGLHLAPERRQIGYVAQEGALFPHLSVASNIVFGLPRRQRRVRYRVDELLRMVGLAPSYAERLPHELSGGEQQRVALARALARQPALVLLDEPFSALDAALRLDTRMAVAAAIADAGATAMLVTHDQSEALSMGHQVAVLRHGQLIQVADPRTLYQRPVDADLARFVGEAVLLPGMAAGNRVSCLLGSLVLAEPMRDGPVEVMIRPEQIRTFPEHEPGILAQAESVTFYGPDATVQLRVGDAVMLSARMAGLSVPAGGSRIRLQVEGAVMAFAQPGTQTYIA